MSAAWWIVPVTTAEIPSSQPVPERPESDLSLEGDIGPHEHEPHHDSTSGLLNWLRAAVLGANDGIVSTAGLVMGVAGATSERHTIFVAGSAGLVAGALSMAAGEYVSVSTQRDTEQALLAKERRELAEDPEDELAELAGIYRDKGLSDELAIKVAEELTAHDALAAHADAELNIDPDDLTSPWQAAVASLISFTLGGALPLLTIMLFGQSARIAATVVAVALALALTGFASARFAEADARRAVVRNVVGGLLAMVVTYLIGGVIGGHAG
ncbi:MAG: rane protein [Marmoricola sp.]|nr:rane protein [Marmoricola sp.]